MSVDGGVGGVGASASTQTGETQAESVASQLVRDNTVDGQLDTAGLAAGVRAQTEADPELGASVIGELDAQLTPVERGQLAAALETANDNGPDRTELIADVTQIGLDIVGIVDPTGIADISNAAISVARGNWLDAAISVAGVLPLVGDATKLGKLGGWAQTLSNAVDLAKVDAGFRAAVEPGLRQLADALDAAPLDMLPASARETLQGIRTKLDEVLDGSADAAARAANNLVGASTRTGRVGNNSATWTLDAQGRPTRGQATLTELHDGTPRSSAEQRAQSATGRSGIEGDQGGHIIGHRFLPDQGTVNMFPQAGQFNNSAYRTMENEWASWIEAGGEVRVDVQLSGYNGARPSDVDVSYEVFNAQGEKVYSNFEMFENEAGQTFDRVSTADIRAMLNP